MDNSQAVSQPETMQNQAMVAPKTNVLAIVSLVAGILGVFFFGSLIAVICGHIARGQIRDSQGQETGDGLAVTGLVLGYLMLVLTILIVIAMVFFGFGMALLS